jgi:hypothetical protein
MYRKLSVLLAIAALLLAACAHRDRAAAGATAPPRHTTTSVAAPAPTTAVPAPPSTAAPRKGHVLADGRYPAFLTALDVSRRTVTFDVIQWFSGAAAEEAYHQDHPETEGGPPNSFYIRNASPRLRTLPVRRDVPVQVVWLVPGAGSEATTFEALPAYFAGDVAQDDDRIWYDPFWLTVRGDQVVSMNEQYIP